MMLSVRWLRQRCHRSRTLARWMAGTSPAMVKERRGMAASKLGRLHPATAPIDTLRATVASALRRRSYRFRIIVELGCQPALRFGETPAFAPRVILPLVALDLADAEITRLGMREIYSAYRRTGPHGITLRERHARARVRIE